MEQIAIAIAIYKKEKPKTPENIIGLKIFPMGLNSSRPDYSQPAMIIWRQNAEALFLTGLEAPVFESQPLPPKK